MCMVELLKSKGEGGCLLVIDLTVNKNHFFNPYSNENVSTAV